MDVKMKSRKLWFFSALSIIFTSLQVGGFLPIDAVVYSNMMFGVMMGYAGGNVGDKIAERPRH